MKYQANPVIVEAVRIAEIGEIETDGSRLLKLDETDADLGIQYSFRATNEMLCRIPNLQLGDYVVRQEDGYLYLNPAAVFERKYSLYIEPAQEGSGDKSAIATAADAVKGAIGAIFGSNQQVSTVRPVAFLNGENINLASADPQ